MRLDVLWFETRFRECRKDWLLVSPYRSVCLRTVPDRIRRPCVSGHTPMARFDGVDPSEWNEGIFSRKGRFSMLPLYLMRSFDS